MHLPNKHCWVLLHVTYVRLMIMYRIYLYLNSNIDIILFFQMFNLKNMCLYKAITVCVNTSNQKLQTTHRNVWIYSFTATTHKKEDTIEIYEIINLTVKGYGQFSISPFSEYYYNTFTINRGRLVINISNLVFNIHNTNIFSARSI